MRECDGDYVTREFRRLLEAKIVEAQALVLRFGQSLQELYDLQEILKSLPLEDGAHLGNEQEFDKDLARLKPQLQ